ncbi:ABC transporter ATP-binding protein [Halorussus salinus]|uniref:ABC transporter ATP-binding protein n=1 Tax=Halorussus salinus TaxID=1364935 RepID=UPI001091F5EC|nr:ABC transporter ATP-binding protein [Halorussus salinus]
MNESVLVAEDIAKSFGGTPVFDGIDLTVDTGEIVVLMGPNGTGKSVLVSCLAGGLVPSAGSVEIDGEPPAASPGATSFLLQDALILDRLTGRENIAFYDRLNPSFTDRWRTLVEEFGIGERLDDRVEHYSGGMRRKLELAISLSVEAPLYVLDEPTAALDLTMVSEIHHRLSTLRDRGKAVLVTTHLPMDADVADRIVFFTDDGVAAEGTPAEIKSSVPPVVETSLGNTDAIADDVIDGRVFRGDGVVRGLLAPETDPSAVADGLADARVTEPTYADLFNYYTHLRG